MPELFFVGCRSADVACDMSISTHFGDPVLWAQTHFGGVRLGDVRRRRRVCTLAAGWARQPGASIPRLSGGWAYASKAAYHLLGLAAVTPDALQAPHRQLVREHLQQAGTYLLLEDTTQVRWPETVERRAGLGPVGTGQAHEQGVLLHSLVAAGWPPFDPAPATKRLPLPLLGLLDQQFHVRQERPAAEKAHPHGGTRPRQGRARRCRQVPPRACRRCGCLLRRRPPCPSARPISQP